MSYSGRWSFAIALLVSSVAAGCAADQSGGSPIVVDGGSDRGADAGTTSGDTASPRADAPTPDAPSNDTGARPDDTTSAPSPDSDTGDKGPADTGGAPDESPSDCTTTEKYCDGQCVEVLSDPDHCGSCGFACSQGASCVNGICKCAEGNIRCDGRCIDPSSNDDHCFKCGNACPDGQMCQKSVCVEKNLQKAAIKYINRVRQTPTDCDQYGTKPAGPDMTVNAELDKAAQAYAERMAEKGFFAHKDPYDGSDFVERVNRTNYQGTVLGENLSRGLRQSAKRVVEGWRKSDSHCRVMANADATELGLGLAHPDSGKFDAYWVLLVGRQ
ncbi:MAG: CAP domain-containing protein [Bradymonadaceae bacterium]